MKRHVPRLKQDNRPQFSSLVTFLKLLTLTTLLIFFAAPAFALQGDFDGDCNVDRDDLAILLADRNMSVADSNCGEGCDLDSDGIITVLDSRKLVLLCTASRCAIIPDSCQVNHLPVASAGTDQTVYFCDTVILDGSGSTDIDGDPISFNWSLETPVDSLAVLSDYTTIQPTFIVDHEGPFVAELIINDGLDDSVPDQVVISTQNSPPVAIATVAPGSLHYVGQIVTLDGSNSYDVDSDPLTFSWTIAQQPSGTQASIQDFTSGIAYLVLEEPGDYILELKVNDGQAESDSVRFTITTGNNKPVAVIEQAPENPVDVGVPIYLDGSSSNDGDNNPLVYDWVLTNYPGGSVAGLTQVDPPEDASLITITPDLPGDYLIQLIVNDSYEDSEPATQLIDTWTTVPDVLSMDIDNASIAIQAAGLTVGNILEQNNITSAGQVFDQDPVAGERLDTIAPVHLWVSLGPETVTVPNVVGLPQVTAESTITAANLSVDELLNDYINKIEKQLSAKGLQNFLAPNKGPVEAALEEINDKGVEIINNKSFLQNDSI